MEKTENRHKVIPGVPQSGRFAKNESGQNKKAGLFAKPAFCAQEETRTLMPVGHHPLKMACLPVSPPGPVVLLRTRERKDNSFLLLKEEIAILKNTANLSRSLSLAMTDFSFCKIELYFKA
jgi:hypothetical protein